MTPRRHLALAVFFAVLLPAGSLVQGSGLLAFRMFAASRSARLGIVTWDERGASRPVSATALAALAGGSLGDVLAGADHWKLVPAPRYLSAHLQEIASLACSAVRGAKRVEVKIDLRVSLDAPVESSSAERRCP
jgi:hypothetical protein